jgi:putative acetyltransferase
LEIRPADLDDARVIELLETHVRTARAETAVGSAHALDLTSLKTPDISVWVVWDDDGLPVGVGALKRLSTTEGEIKSMHTVARARRTGVGSTMLAHLLGVARTMGLARLSLETGSWPYFAPARALYAAHGFVECAPFGSYRDDPNSVFMTLALDAALASESDSEAR